MSLNIINKAVNSAKGGGLPFYTSIDYVFSAENKGFNDSIGLWRVPANKVPAFQLWLEQANNVSLKYLETTGGGVLTGTTFTLPFLITPVAVTDDGVNKWIYETDDSGTLIIAAPIGRWIIEFKADNGGADTVYYSEEFITCVD